MGREGLQLEQNKSAIVILQLLYMYALQSTEYQLLGVLLFALATISISAIHNFIHNVMHA